MPRPFSLLLALVAGALCAGVVACAGGDDEGLLPSGRASTMADELDRVEQAVRNGDCEALSGRIEDLQNQVNRLSNDVDPRLRTRLQEGVNHLAQISPSACLEQQTDTTDTLPEEEEPAPTETTPQTETDTTEEPPPETTEDPPVETTPEDTAPPEETVPQGSGGATVPEGSADPEGTGGVEPTP